jgi:hypothetical protein
LGHFAYGKSLITPLLLRVISIVASAVFSGGFGWLRHNETSPHDNARCGSFGAGTSSGEPECNNRITLASRT